MDWQPIETAPRDGTHVLLFGEHNDGGPNQFVGYWEPSKDKPGPFGDFVWREQSGASITAENIVTHWMHLPKPPAT